MGLRFRLHNNSCCFFVTTTVVNFVRLFTSEPLFKIVVENVNFYREKYGCKLIAYVFMPSHLHLILWPGHRGTLSDFMRDFKKFTSVQVKEYLVSHERSNLVKRFEESSIGYKGQNFKLWMDRFDNVAIASPDVLETKITYIHDNPVRAGLVREAVEWKHSSARNYFLGDHSVLRVDSECVLVDARNL